MDVKKLTLWINSRSYQTTNMRYTTCYLCFKNNWEHLSILYGFWYLNLFDRQVSLGTKANLSKYKSKQNLSEHKVKTHFFVSNELDLTWGDWTYKMFWFEEIFLHMFYQNCYRNFSTGRVSMFLPFKINMFGNFIFI